MIIIIKTFSFQTSKVWRGFTVLLCMRDERAMFFDEGKVTYTIIDMLYDLLFISIRIKQTQSINQ